MEMKDSGKRQQFEGGAVRDTDEGKPTMHLLSPHVYELAVHVHDNLYRVSSLARGRTSGLCSYTAAKLASFSLTGESGRLSELLTDLLSVFGVERLVRWLELGAKKYEAFNWAKGMYISRCMDSALRHLDKVARDMADEDHTAAVMCNLMFMLHYKLEIEAGRLDSKWDDMFRYDRLTAESSENPFSDCSDAFNCGHSRGNPSREEQNEW